MILTPLSSLLRIGSAGVAGYGEDKADAVKEALTQQAAQRQATKDAIDNALAQKNLAQIRPGDVGYGAYNAGVISAENPAKAAGARLTAEATAPVEADKAVNIATRTAPIDTQKAIDIAKGTAPIAEGTHQRERLFDNTNQPPDKPQISVQQPAEPGGSAKAVVIDANDVAHPRVSVTDIPGTAKGAIASQAGSAPIAARAGQMGLALRAAGKLIPLHEQLGVSGIPLGAQTAGETAAGDNIAAHVPGAKELANIGLNLSGDYAVYKAGLPNLILGATHAISGARINKQQADLLASGLEIRKGDQPAVVSKKLDDIVDFLNSMRASVPPDLGAKQEAGIDPATMAILKKHGYGGAPNGTAFGLIQQVVPDFKPAGASSPAAASGGPPSYEDWKKANGIP